jgi:hypothetical protein
VSERSNAEIHASTSLAAPVGLYVVNVRRQQALAAIRQSGQEILMHAQSEGPVALVGHNTIPVGQSAG